MSIDLRMIKAGDIVTAERSDWSAFDEERKGYTITGEVYEADNRLWVGPISIGLNDVTITDHQPAPETEPEWKIGHLYEADVQYVGRVQVMWTNGPPLTEDNAYPEEYPWFVPSEDDFFTSSVVTNVKPLIIFDPEVDVDGLKRVLASADYDYQAQADAALKFLGIKEGA